MNKPVQKMSLLDALTRFRNEIKDLNLPSSQRVKLLEDFKYAFNRSLDYDMAFDRVSSQIAPEFAHSMTFKSFWKEFNTPEEFGKLFGFSELERSKKVIDEELKSGKREVDVINEILITAQEQFGRPLEQSEIDKVRYLVISEKVKLRREGIKIQD